MKKKFRLTRGCEKNVRLQKIWMIMKLTMFLFFLGIIQTMASEAYSQTTKLTLQLKDVAVKQVLTQIEDESEFFFLYNSKLVDVNRKVDVDAKDERIDDILNSLFQKTDVVYTVVDRQIVLTNKADQAGFIQSGQQTSKKVTGKVTDRSGTPVPGAAIIVKGTTTGVTTDKDGKFSLSLPAEAKALVFSFIGMKTQEIEVGNNATINVVLEEETVGIEEVVAVGYGTQSKRNITGAISSVKAQDMQTANAVSIDNMLQGKAAGLVISQRSAQPAGGSNVNIRGYLSPNGGNEPLYVVDGVQIGLSGNPFISQANNNNFVDGTDRSPLSSMNPSDIESVDILKDASATAIYGSAAANGVILITTKRGKTGEPSVTLGESYSIQKIYNEWNVLDATQFMQQANLVQNEYWLFNNRYAPYGTTAAPTATPTPYYSNEQIANAGKGYNHLNDITRIGRIWNQDLSISGGSEKTKYYASFNYFDQKSLLKTTNFKRYSGRINLDQTFNSWLKLSINSMYTSTDASNPSTGGTRQMGNEARQTNAAIIFPPYIKLENEDGTLNKSDYPLGPNPAVWNYITDETLTNRLFISPNLEVKVNPELKINFVLGVDNTSAERSLFSPTKSQLPEQIPKNFGGYGNNYDNNISADSYISYDKKIGEENHISALLGVSYYKTKLNNYNISVFNLPTDALENNAIQQSTDKDLAQYSSYRFERTKLSQFARLDYQLKDKYLIGFTVRRDGSTAFAPDHKWGIFPGISAGWVISEEPFLKGNQTLGFIKLRAGWGTSGNESTVNNSFGYFNTYSSYGGYDFYFGGALQSGLLQTSQGNTDLKWETDITQNIGLDFKMLGNRLKGSFDFYVRTAKDLLDFARLPSNQPISQIAKNIGSTRSRGIEIELQGDIIQSGKFKWSVSLTANHNRSFWLVRNPEVGLSPWIGEHDDIFALYGWQTNGIFKSLDEVQNYTSNGNVLQPNSYPGNLKYIDQNKDGILDGKDVVNLGTSTPKVNFGFGTSLKFGDFDLNINTYGALGMKTYNGWSAYSDPYFLNLLQNQSVHIYEGWSSHNPNGWRPGVASSSSPTESNNPSASNDFTLQTTNFIRLKDITLGYNIPQDWLSKSKISRNAKIYVDLQNIALLTNYKGLDPEMEQNVAPFPIPFTIVFGLNVTF